MCFCDWSVTKEQLPAEAEPWFFPPVSKTASSLIFKACSGLVAYSWTPEEGIRLWNLEENFPRCCDRVLCVIQMTSDVTLVNVPHGECKGKQNSVFNSVCVRGNAVWKVFVFRAIFSVKSSELKAGRPSFSFWICCSLGGSPLAPYVRSLSVKWCPLSVHLPAR